MKKKFICRDCNREVETLLMKKVKCKICRKPMEEIKEEKIINKPKEENRGGWRPSIYTDEDSDIQKFKINGKIVYAKRTGRYP